MTFPTAFKMTSHKNALGFRGKRHSENIGWHGVPRFVLGTISLMWYFHTIWPAPKWCDSERVGLTRQTTNLITVRGYVNACRVRGNLGSSIWVKHSDYRAKIVPPTLACKTWVTGKPNNFPSGRDNLNYGVDIVRISWQYAYSLGY